MFSQDFFYHSKSFRFFANYSAIGLVNNIEKDRPSHSHIYHLKFFKETRKVFFMPTYRAPV